MLAPSTQATSLAQVLPQVLPGMQDAASGGADRKSYGKRELSTSKRAEQNRAAQVRFFCFRPRPVLTRFSAHSVNEKKAIFAN